MKIKNVSVLVLVCSIIEILLNIYWSVLNVLESWDYWKLHLVGFVVGRLGILLPISLLLLSIALIKNSKETVHTESSLSNDESMTVGDWLLNFFINSIPIIGLVFLVIWANDESNKVKKNWAIATLIWMVITVVLVLSLYLIIIGSIAKHL